MAAKRSMPSIQLNYPAKFHLASVKQEPLQSPPSLPPPEYIPQSLAFIKTEPEQEQQSPQQQLLEKQEKEPKFLKSIDDLVSLSSAIEAFKCKFEELTKHLDFINEAIDSKLNESQEEKLPQVETQPPLKLTEADEKTEKGGSEGAPPLKSSRSEIENLCESMCSKGLRKYIVTHLKNVSMLREEVPAALKLAPNPAKLVFDCIGRFFLQGIKAYTKDSPMIPARQASILALEFFLLMMGGSSGRDEANIPKDVKVEAEKGAIAWRKRLNCEGGLARASEIDARGLLLFVASFGIPRSFRSEDLGNLLRLCNLRAISDALKGSPLLSAKIPGIIEGMAKNGMYVEAVDIASVFGLEDKFSCKRILTLFLQDSAITFKKAKKEAQNSPIALRKANEKQLDALKSIVHYLEDCCSDAMSLVGTWHIKEKIVKLEEEIAELQKRIEDEKVILKRKLDEMESSSMVNNQEIKRSRFAVKGSPLLKSSHVNRLHEQSATLAEGIRSYDGLVPNALDSDIYGHLSNYPAASSVLHRLAVGSFPESGEHTVGINGVGSSSMVTGIGVRSLSSYSGAHGHVDIGVDKAAQVMSSSGLTYVLGQGSAAQSTTMRYGSLFGSSPSVEGFMGPPELPHSGTADRTAANLYGFVDSVGENESYGNGSQRNGTLPPVTSVRHSSYMYLKN